MSQIFRAWSRGRYSGVSLDLIQSTARPARVKSSNISTSNHPVPLCLARPRRIQTSTPDVRSKYNSQMFFIIGTVVVQMKPHLSPGCRWYPSPHLATDFRQRLQELLRGPFSLSILLRRRYCKTLWPSIMPLSIYRGSLRWCEGRADKRRRYI